MSDDSERPYVEPMRLTDAESYVYEAIATLEYLGRPATRDEIATVADLSDSAINRILYGLTGERLIEERPAAAGSEDGPVYTIVHRAKTIAEPDEPQA